MSSGWIHRQAYIECDGKSCHETVEGGSIEELWNSAQTDGWTGKKDERGEWRHFCPDCSRPFPRIRVVKP